MKKVYLYLINKGEYQLSLQRSAEEAARRFGFELQVFFADDDAAKQQSDMFAAVWGEKIERPYAVIASLAKYGMHADAVMEAAAQRGVNVIYVNHVSPKLKEFQQRFSDKGVLTAFVGPDQYKAGCIQGQQLLNLMPNGGDLLLYITGPGQAFATIERKRGFMDVIGKSGVSFRATIEREAGWKLETATAQTLKTLEYLRFSASKVKLCVVAQSDPMGKGIREALIQMDNEVRQSDPNVHEFLNLTKVPVLGIDGLEHGKRWVGENTLQATVVMQSCTMEAMELLHRFSTGGEGGNVFLEPVSHPDLKFLRPALPAA